MVLLLNLSSLIKKPLDYFYYYFGTWNNLDLSLNVNKQMSLNKWKLSLPETIVQLHLIVGSLIHPGLIDIRPSTNTFLNLAVISRMGD